MPFSDHLHRFQKQVKREFKPSTIKDIEFSDSTYQVLVEDPETKKQHWVFLQLERNGDIKDAFCSCDHDTEFAGCLHLALAYAGLFGQSSLPLHRRFSQSIWNHICRLYEEGLGDDPNLLQQTDPNTHVYISPSGKKLFVLQTRTPEAADKVKKILHARLMETEETSLKFSNIPSEEIALWRQGKPNPQLRYDLSFWSDLAKWFMQMQEEGVPYECSFKYSKKKLPNWLQCNFEEVKVGFFLSETSLLLLIESLPTVKSPLSVYHEGHKRISQITYNKQEQILHVEAKKEKNPSKKKIDSEKEKISFHEWTFVQGDGFYAKESHELLKNPDLHGEDIAHMLSEHTRLISSLLIDCQVHRETIPLSYTLHFDKEWNLHIAAYLFHPGDLTSGHAWLIDPWAYIEDDGFYPVANGPFHQSETIVSSYQVADFITKNRGWLNKQEGFQTHIRSLEYQLTYQVSKTKRLTFHRTIPYTKNLQHDFGSWVYVENFGFYSKTSGSLHHLLRPGVSLSGEQVPLFLRVNREELSLIPGFFSATSPLASRSLSITLDNQKKIHIQPHTELFPSFADKTPLFFDDFVFVEGNGFYEIPLSWRIPEKYREPVEISEEEIASFFATDFPHILPFSSYIDPRLLLVDVKQLMIRSIVSSPQKGRGWYSFRLTYDTDKGPVPAISLLPELKKKQSFAFLDVGVIALKNSRRFNWLLDLPNSRFDWEKGTILLTTLEFLRLNAYETLGLLTEGTEEEISHTHSLFEHLLQLHNDERPNLSGLMSHLRPYQEVGAHWLWFLYREQLSALLCDDMGLGKTHQAMALVASVCNLFRNHAEGTSCYFLIVCPTSVLYHWQEKLEQFLPTLRVCPFYGSNRSLQNFHEQYDIVLTSYGILRNEQHVLEQISFEVAIFDEIQIAKNQSSRIYEALRKMQSKSKVGLTGTPIENHLRELKSLFDIILPSYMPPESEYRELFIKPIEREHNIDRKIALNRLIRPFVLRRKKEDVLKELPEKMEENAYCDLSPYQRQLYQEVLLQKRHHFLKELEDQQHAIPYMHIFALLSHLKQICDHPAVYLKKPESFRDYASGKWDLFLEILREARESQQKVVVFSQYLGMLDIIEDYLREHRIGFASLRGSTQDRKEQLQFFHRDPQCEIFVGSLQAAGLGIDLTAASVVVHYDRWWNAARENQATDRVHRHGQLRGVQVFKLITKHTFEEKIDAMILRKEKLMEDVVGVDDQNVFKTFTRKELIDLLSLSNS